MINNYSRLFPTTSKTLKLDERVGFNINIFFFFVYQDIFHSHLSSDIVLNILLAKQAPYLNSHKCPPSKIRLYHISNIFSSFKFV